MGRADQAAAPAQSQRAEGHVDHSWKTGRVERRVESFRGDALERSPELVGVAADRVRGAELLRQLEAPWLGVDRDDLRRTGGVRRHDRREADAAAAEHRHAVADRHAECPRDRRGPGLNAAPQWCEEM